MARYVPTIEEFNTLRGQLTELAKDYLLLYQMDGVRNNVDLHLDRIDRSERAEAALQSTKDLIAQVERIEGLAETDAEALGDEWQDVLDILEHYSFHYVDVETGVVHSVHEPFKPLWVAARALGLDTGEIDEAVANLRRGRPKDSTRIPLLKFPLLYRQAYVEEKDVADSEGRPVRRLDVAQRLGLEDPKTLRAYLGKTGEDWPPTI
jgi:hypothetical protein